MVSADILLRPKKSLGQNFLTDDNIARNTVRAMQLSPEDVVVEIGPGIGALTKHLAGRAGHLVAVELDKKIADNLKKQFRSRNVEIVHLDFLNLSLSDLKKKHRCRVRLIGNIPYHLTSPILFKAFEEHESVRDLTIMVQLEVARRIAAKPGKKDYGILPVLSQFYGIPKSLFNVSPNCFYPKPKVISSVISVRFFEELPFKVDEELFKIIVKTSFGKRRKTIRNGLSYLPFPKQVVEKIVAGVEFPLDKRPEQLSVEQFALLAGQIGDLLE